MATSNCNDCTFLQYIPYWLVSSVLARIEDGNPQWGRLEWAFCKVNLHNCFAGCNCWVYVGWGDVGPVYSGASLWVTGLGAKRKVWCWQITVIRAKLHRIGLILVQFYILCLFGYCHRIVKERREVGKEGKRWEILDLNIGLSITC